MVERNILLNPRMALKWFISHLSNRLSESSSLRIKVTVL